MIHRSSLAYNFKSLLYRLTGFVVLVLDLGSFAGSNLALKRLLETTSWSEGDLSKWQIMNGVTAWERLVPP
jgi:hypothetical protein